MSAKSHRKSAGKAARQASTGQRSQQQAPEGSGLEALQPLAGNQATSALVGGGLALPPDVRDEMEARFGYDLSAVRVHTDGAAQKVASLLHARAYTVGKDIAFAEGQYRPEAHAGRVLLAHELAHAIQQTMPGTSVAADSPAAEAEAVHAGESAGRGGEASIGVAASAGVATAPEDWLVGTPGNIQRETEWPASRIQDEIDEIREWLGRQISSSEEMGRLREVLQELEEEQRRRAGNVAEASLDASRQQKRRRRKKRGRRRRGKKKQETIPEDAQNAEVLPDKPRILREGTSEAYEDASEVRAEVDSILFWLARKDLKPDERKILEAELHNLAPEYEQDRVNRAVNRRAKRIQRALEPSDEDKVVARRLINAVKIIDSIKPIPFDGMNSELVVNGERHVLSNEEAYAIKSDLIEKLDAAKKQIAAVNAGSMSTWQHQTQVNQEEWFAGAVVSWMTGDSPTGPDAFLRNHSDAQIQLQTYEIMKKQGRLVGMAKAISLAELNARWGRIEVDRWIGRSLAAAEKAVGVLKITRNLAFSIAASGLGGAGIASLLRGGMSLARAGLTVSAVGAATGGTVRGGADLAGQALAGGDIDFGQSLREGGRGALSAGMDAPVGAVVKGTQTVLRAGQGASKVRQVGAAAIGSGIGGSMSELGQGQLPSFQNFGVNALTGGVAHRLNLGIASRYQNAPSAVRTSLEVAGEATIGGIGAELSGGSFYEGAGTSLVVGAGTRGATGPSGGSAPPRKPPPAAPRLPSVGGTPPRPPRRPLIYTDQFGLRQIEGYPPVEHGRTGATPEGSSSTPAPRAAERGGHAAQPDGRFPDLPESLAEQAPNLPEPRQESRNPFPRRVPNEFGRRVDSAGLAAESGIPDLGGDVVTSLDFAEPPVRRQNDVTREGLARLPNRRARPNRNRAELEASDPELAARLDDLDVPPEVVDEVLRGVGGTRAQNLDVLHDVQMLLAAGADPDSIRVNRMQVGAGSRDVAIGVNRPDLQATINGRRVFVEYDRFPMDRASPHAQRLLANDPDAIVILKGVGHSTTRR